MPKRTKDKDRKKKKGSKPCQDGNTINETTTSIEPNNTVEIQNSTTETNNGRYTYNFKSNQITINTNNPYFCSSRSHNWIMDTANSTVGIIQRHKPRDKHN